MANGHGFSKARVTGTVRQVQNRLVMEIRKEMRPRNVYAATARHAVLPDFGTSQVKTSPLWMPGGQFP